MSEGKIRPLIADAAERGIMEKQIEELMKSVAALNNQVAENNGALNNRIDALKRSIAEVAENLSIARNEVTKDIALIRSDGQRQLDELRAAVHDLRSRGAGGVP